MGFGRDRQWPRQRARVKEAGAKGTFAKRELGAGGGESESHEGTMEGCAREEIMYGVRVQQEHHHR